MTDQEKSTLCSVLLRLIDDGQALTPLERRDLISQITSGMCDMTADEILSATQNNRKLCVKRGTTTQNDTYTGAAGEITMDTDANALRIHDGTTPGGHPVGGGNLADTNLSNITSTGQNNIRNLFKLDWSNKTDHTNHTQITIQKDGFLFCRGSVTSLDLVSSDFNTVIFKEYILSSNYSTSWAPVIDGQYFKTRSTSDFQAIFFIPFITA